MTWLRAVCGRLEGSYRYSGGVVFNNFVFPNENEDFKEKITQSAKKIIEVRQKHSDCSPSTLYKLMPKDLLDAHRDNDRQVMLAYGFDPNLTETELLEKLFELYEKKMEELKSKSNR